jgi:hypothetical protein
LDLKAVKALYGPPSADKKYVSHWNWNPKTSMLVLKGKPGNDILQGTGTKDALFGKDGNDKLLGLSGKAPARILWSAAPERTHSCSTVSLQIQMSTESSISTG